MFISLVVGSHAGIFLETVSHATSVIRAGFSVPLFLCSF
uniref:Uncharacterized protein n=1 Tax=Anguilla anguilla TaxID=7936 RepID=A0A0E9WDL1_ANGAN